MKSKEAIERHIKELLSEMTVEEKLDELDPNIMGIDWEKIEEPMRRECLEKLEKRHQWMQALSDTVNGRLRDRTNTSGNSVFVP